MALIDLSKFDVQVNPLAVDKQIYNDQGAAAYKALAGVGHQVNKIATEMYAKHMDVFTDRETLAGTEIYKTSMADKSQELLMNIDENTDLVKGTNQTYEEAMGEYAISERSRIAEGLTETQSRNKFDFAVTPLMAEELRNSTNVSAKITVTNTLNRAQKQYSAAANAIIGADSLSVERNLNGAIADTDQYAKMIEKTSGLTTAQRVRREGVAKLLDASLDTSLRNMAAGNPNAELEFNSILGIGVMFKTKGAYKKFVMQTLEDTATSPEELEKTVDLIVENAFLDTNVRTAGHPDIDLLSPEVKIAKVKQALSIKWKIKAEGKDKNSLQMGDWKAAPSRTDFTPSKIPTWLVEGAQIMTSSNYEGDNTTRLRDTTEASDQQMVQDYVVNELTKGKTGFDDFLKNYAANRELYVKAVLIGQGVMTEQEYADVRAKNPSIGSTSALGAERTLRAKQAEIQLKMARDPLYYYQTVPGNNETSAMAIRLVNGKIVIDNTNLALAQKNMEDMMLKVGTTASSLETANILPTGQLNDIANALQLASPADQIEVYKKLNQSPKLAMRIYSQMVAQGKITPEQAAQAANLGMGDSKTADAMNANLISIKNKWTKEARTNLIKDLHTEGWMGMNQSYKDVQEMVAGNIAESKFMQGLKTTAKTSGMTDAEINNTYQNDAIQVIVLDKLSKTLPEYVGMKGRLFGGLESTIKKVTDEAIQEYYGSRIKPINSANLNVVSLPEGVDEAKVTERAAELSKTIKKELSEGRLQVDFSDYKDMQKAKKYNTLSQDLKQKFWLRDVAEEISFNGTDVTGKSQDVVAMFKDSNGQYYRLKLKTPDGKSFVPVIKNVREFQNGDANSVHQKYFSQGIHTPQLKAPTPRTLPPAPKPSAAGIADDVVSTMSGAKDTSATAAFLKKEEGIVLSPEDDNYGNMAVGHGHTPLKGEKFDKPLTAEEADKLLIKDIAAHQGGAMKKLKVPLNANEKTALTSLAFNKGASSDPVKRVVNLINAGRRKEAAKEFLKYGSVQNKKTGKWTEDLLPRRKREMELFLTPVK